MTVNVIQTIAAGFDRLEFGILDNNGFFAGATGVVTAGAVGAAPGRMKAVKVANPTVPNPDAVPITGDNDYQGGFIFSSNAVRAFDIEAAVDDFNIVAALQQTNVENQGDISLGLLDPEAANYPSVCLLLVSNAQSKMAGSGGVTGFSGLIVPKCQLVPLGRPQFQERGAASVKFRVVVNSTDRYPFGKTFTDATNGTTGTRFIPWTAENRISMMRFDGDAATTTFGNSSATPHTPASSSLSKNRVFVNGLIQNAGVTPNVGARTITFGAAPAATPIVWFYEYTE